MNDEDQLMEVMDKANAWINEAKPLLDRGGKAEALLRALCEQIEKLNPSDEIGHHVTMNLRYQEARDFLNPPQKAAQ